MKKIRIDKKNPIFVSRSAYAAIYFKMIVK